MNDNNEMNLDVFGPNVSNTCEKCYWGDVFSPFDTFCAKYKNKPSSIYFEGGECIYFEPKEKEENKNEQ